MTNPVNEITEQTRGLDAQALVEYALRRFGERVALASSFGAEDQVVTDMLCKASARPRVFTLDTGRLPQETYDVLDITREKYGLAIEVLFPDRQDVEAMVNQEGVNLFYRSIELRKRCCHVRKVVPLRRKLATLDAWITGLRRQQATTRGELGTVQWDEANGLVKLNPLADWTTEQVWDYIRQHHVPCNRLHDRGYPSIGCAPCTRAVEPGQDLRAGRWWWEPPEHKECGLHLVDGKLVRKGGSQ